MTVLANNENIKSDDLLILAQNAEEIYSKKIQIKKLAFVALGLTGMGLAAISAPLLTKITPAIYPAVVGGGIGMIPLVSLLLKTAKEELNDNILSAKCNLLDIYDNLTDKQADNLYTNKSKLSKSIAEVREQYLAPKDKAINKKLT